MKLVTVHDDGDDEGLTDDQIRQLAPGCDISRNGCPAGESTPDVGRRTDALFHTHVENATQPVVVVAHGHSSRIFAARARGPSPECGRLFASETASVSFIEDHPCEQGVVLWNVDAALLADIADGAPHPDVPRAHPLLPAPGALR